MSEEKSGPAPLFPADFPTVPVGFWAGVPPRGPGVVFFTRSDLRYLIIAHGTGTETQISIDEPSGAHLAPLVLALLEGCRRKLTRGRQPVDDTPEGTVWHVEGGRLFDLVEEFSRLAGEE